MMTKKHFKKIAEILNKKHKSEEKGNIETINFNLMIDDFCFYFQTDNPNFDEEKFREAVMINSCLNNKCGECGELWNSEYHLSDECINLPEEIK